MEYNFTCHPVLEPSFLYGGCPPTELVDDESEVVSYIYVYDADDFQQVYLRFRLGIAGRTSILFLAKWYRSAP